MIAYADGIIGSEGEHFMGSFCIFSSWRWIIGLIFLIVVGLVIYYAVKGMREKGVPDDNLTKEALDALKLRYAKGEITEEEYEKIKKELHSTRD